MFKTISIAPRSGLFTTEWGGLFEALLKFSIDGGGE